MLLKLTLLFLFLKRNSNTLNPDYIPTIYFFNFHIKLLVGTFLESLFYYHSLNKNLVLYELIVCMEVIASMEMQTADPNLDINYR